MFLTVLALPRPEFGFDGKIGIWRVCNTVTAARKTKNHNVGDEWEQDCNVTSEWYRNCMIKEGGILDTICEQMPWMIGRRVYVQHDGAPGHNGMGNVQMFEDESIRGEFTLLVRTQPAQSPDLNVNDLGFFRSLKSRVNHFKDRGGSLMNMIDSVYEMWSVYDNETLTRLWAVQAEYYRQILRDLGGNQFQNPHSGVRKRERAGDPIIDLQVDAEDYQIAYDYLND